MEDPFVKRMMERTKARNKVLGRVTVTDKLDSCLPKNSSEESISNINIFNQNIKDEVVRADKPEIIAFKDELSLLKKKTSAHNSNELSDTFYRSEVSQSQEAASPRKRYNKLALVSQRLEEWEDDYSYHSVCRGNSEKVESKIVKTVHVAGNVIENAVDNQNTNLNNQHSKFLPSKSYNNNSPKSKYFFGETASTANTEEGLSFLTGNVSAPHLYQSPSNTSYHTAKSSISSPSPKSCRNISISSPISHNAKETPFSKCMSLSQSKQITPTKQLAWDKQLIKSLHYQFTSDVFKDTCISQEIKEMEDAFTIPENKNILVKTFQV